MSAPTPSPNDEPRTPAWIPVVGALLFAALLAWWFVPARTPADATVRVRATAADAEGRPPDAPAPPPAAPAPPAAPR